MTNLYSQYASGLQLTAGAIAGSSLGTSGLNPIVDRLNSISQENNIINVSTGSVTATDISGVGISCNNITTSWFILTDSLSAKSYTRLGSYMHMHGNNYDNAELAAENGTIYYNVGSHSHFGYDGVNWIPLGASGTTLNVSANTINTGDHGASGTDQVVNVCYGTGSTPPTASTTTEGALYIQYIA